MSITTVSLLPPKPQPNETSDEYRERTGPELDADELVKMFMARQSALRERHKERLA